MCLGLSLLDSYSCIVASSRDRGLVATPNIHALKASHTVPEEAEQLFSSQNSEICLAISHSIVRSEIQLRESCHNLLEGGVVIWMQQSKGA